MPSVVDPERPDLGGNVRHGDIYSWTPRLWRFLVERFSVRSMLDIGCGEGHAVQFFHRLGVHAHGIDGLALNIERAVIPIALHDILAAPYRMPVDLAWSCEVAEHIAEDKVDNYLDTLCNGRVVAMTHAIPGQDGHNHVNCQPVQYWLDRMWERGFTLSYENNVYRDIARKEEAWNYFQESGLVFTRN